MKVQSFYRQMTDYAHWRETLIQHFYRHLNWVERNQIGQTGDELVLKKALARLRRDTFKIACVGEFSRGKTELLNALFYATLGRRLLPSSPGRTTMCPTEIFYDAESSPGSVKLLPIETRRAGSQLESFKKIPQKWVTQTFTLDDSESLAETLESLSQTKWVTDEDAIALGFDPVKLIRTDDGRLEVPAWRHALVNVDHPLLRHGLRILDTPGLNALGDEPALTWQSLKQTDAVLFVLSADMGVSTSDKAIWDQYQQDLAKHGLLESALVVLNKVDNLRDPTRSVESVAEQIKLVRENTARTLQLPSEKILLLSARQAVLSQWQSQPEQLQQSGLPELEAQLAQRLIRSQELTASHPTLVEAMQVMNRSRKKLKADLQRMREDRLRLQDTLSSSGQFDDTVSAMTVELKHLHEQIGLQSPALTEFQTRLKAHFQTIQEPMQAQALETFMAKSRQEMMDCWSFLGISKVVETFFAELTARFSRLDVAVMQTNDMLKEIYQTPAALMMPEAIAEATEESDYLFDVAPHRQRLERLQQEADHFRRAVGNMFSFKNKLVERFSADFESNVRAMSEALQLALEDWQDHALSPIVESLQCYKNEFSAKKEQLTQLQQQRKSTLQQLQRLKSDMRDAIGALSQLDDIHSAIQISGPSFTGTQNSDADVLALASGVSLGESLTAAEKNKSLLSGSSLGNTA